MNAILIAVAAGLVSVVAVKYAADQRRRRIDAEGILHAYQEGERLRDELAKKTEVIKHEQAADKAKVDTGDPAADFDGSLGVLSDISKRRRKT